MPDAKEWVRAFKLAWEDLSPKEKNIFTAMFGNINDFLFTVNGVGNDEETQPALETILEAMKNHKLEELYRAFERTTVENPNLPPVEIVKKVLGGRFMTKGLLGFISGYKSSLYIPTSLKIALRRAGMLNEVGRVMRIQNLDAGSFARFFRWWVEAERKGIRGDAEITPEGLLWLSGDKSVVVFAKANTHLTESYSLDEADMAYIFASDKASKEFLKDLAKANFYMLYDKAGHFIGIAIVGGNDVYIVSAEPLELELKVPRPNLNDMSKLYLDNHDVRTITSYLRHKPTIFASTELGKEGKGFVADIWKTKKGYTVKEFEVGEVAAPRKEALYSTALPWVVGEVMRFWQGAGGVAVCSKGWFKHAYVFPVSGVGTLDDDFMVYVVPDVSVEDFVRERWFKRKPYTKMREERSSLPGELATKAHDLIHRFSVAFSEIEKEWPKMYLTYEQIKKIGVRNIPMNLYERGLEFTTAMEELLGLKKEIDEYRGKLSREERGEYEFAPTDVKYLEKIVNKAIEDIKTIKDTFSEELVNEVMGVSPKNVVIVHRLPLDLKGKSGQEVLAEYDGAKAIANYDDNRVWVVFDHVPPVELRKYLRSKGFLWSPKRKAWVRKLTFNAIHDAVGVLEEYKHLREGGGIKLAEKEKTPTKTPVEAKPTPTRKEKAKELSEKARKEGAEDIWAEAEELKAELERARKLGLLRPAGKEFLERFLNWLKRTGRLEWIHEATAEAKKLRPDINEDVLVWKELVPLALNKEATKEELIKRARDWVEGLKVPVEVPKREELEKQAVKVHIPSPNEVERLLHEVSPYLPKEVINGLKRMAKLYRQYYDLELRAKGIYQTSGVGQAPPIYHRIVNKQVKLNEEFNKIYDKIKNVVIKLGYRRTTLLALANAHNLVSFQGEKHPYGLDITEFPRLLKVVKDTIEKYATKVGGLKAYREEREEAPIEEIEVPVEVHGEKTEMPLEEVAEMEVPPEEEGLRFIRQKLRDAYVGKFLLHGFREDEIRPPMELIDRLAREVYEGRLKQVKAMAEILRVAERDLAEAKKERALRKLGVKREPIPEDETYLRLLRSLERRLEAKGITIDYVLPEIEPELKELAKAVEAGEVSFQDAVIKASRLAQAVYKPPEEAPPVQIEIEKQAPKVKTASEIVEHKETFPEYVWEYTGKIPEWLKDALSNPKEVGEMLFYGVERYLREKAEQFPDAPAYADFLAKWLGENIVWKAVNKLRRKADEGTIRWTEDLALMALERWGGAMITGGYDAFFRRAWSWVKGWIRRNANAGEPFSKAVERFLRENRFVCFKVETEPYRVHGFHLSPVKVGGEDCQPAGYYLLMFAPTIAMKEASYTPELPSPYGEAFRWFAEKLRGWVMQHGEAR